MPVWRASPICTLAKARLAINRGGVGDRIHPTPRECGEDEVAIFAEVLVVARLMNGQKADMAFTSPPYKDAFWYMLSFLFTYAFVL